MEVDSTMSTRSPMPRPSVMPPCRPEVSMASSSISDRGDRVLAEFEQDASRGGRVHKDIEMSTGAYLDFIGNEAHAFAFQLFESIRDIVHVDCHVMQSLAAFRNEFCDY